jgi:hypothetical protein
VTSKHLLTTIGHVEIPRRYYACRNCPVKQTPWDNWSGFVSPCEGRFKAGNRQKFQRGRVQVAAFYKREKLRCDSQSIGHSNNDHGISRAVAAASKHQKLMKMTSGTTQPFEIAGERSTE